MRLVAERRADHRQRAAGAPAGVFDDPAAGAELAAGHGALDHRERHPVLHAAGGIGALPLHPDLDAVVGDDILQADERRVVRCASAYSPADFGLGFDLHEVLGPDQPGLDQGVGRLDRPGSARRAPAPPASQCARSTRRRGSGRRPRAGRPATAGRRRSCRSRHGSAPPDRRRRAPRLPCVAVVPETLMCRARADRPRSSRPAAPTRVPLKQRRVPSAPVRTSYGGGKASRWWLRSPEAVRNGGTRYSSPQSPGIGVSVAIAASRRRRSSSSSVELAPAARCRRGARARPAARRRSPRPRPAAASRTASPRWRSTRRGDRRPARAARSTRCSAGQPPATRMKRPYFICDQVPWRSQSGSAAPSQRSLSQPPHSVP